jgi:hypothetical protein
MLKTSKIWVIAGAFLLTWISLSAQNSTNSPYTRYGYGAIADRSFGAGRAMGGIGYGLRSSKQINPMNPASYSSMDSMTFLFDAGVTIQYSRFKDEGHAQNDINGNLEYFAMQFPVSKNIAMSAGVLPYSQVGYKFGSVSEGDVIYQDVFSGKGGLSEVYVGLSMDIWRKRLALGFNVSYMFGDIDHRSQTYLSQSEAYNLYVMRKVKVHNLKYDFGAQYTHPLSKTERLTFGLAYSPKLRLNTTAYHQVGFDAYFSNMIESDTTRNQGFDLPHSIGFGASYTKDYKLMLAADVSYQGWSQAKFFNTSDDFQNRIKVAIGGEYIPNNFTRLYLERVRYRAGVHYSNSYLKIKGFGYDEYGVNLGAGFPMLDNRSFVNASIEYVRVSPGSNLLIKEQYFRFTLSYTFNELWFFKRRME